MNQKDPTATPIVTSLGLPSGEPEPRIPQPSPVDPVTTPERPDSCNPNTYSPSISIATLSNFTLADTSDDEPPTDPTAVAPHGAFYLEDGNVDVLCRNVLFRVHTSIPSFHSPALRLMCDGLQRTSRQRFPPPSHQSVFPPQRFDIFRTGTPRHHSHYPFRVKSNPSPLSQIHPTDVAPTSAAFKRTPQTHPIRPHHSYHFHPRYYPEGTTRLREPPPLLQHHSFT